MPDQQPYTPDTQDVQWAAITTTFEDSSITEDAFNRWLDARDARIEAAAEHRTRATNYKIWKRLNGTCGGKFNE